MNNNNLSATFTLTTAILSQTTIVPTNVGVLNVNNTRTSMTWFNVDLFTIVGYEMWHKYNFFNISMTNAIIDHIDNMPTDANNRVCSIDLSGLNFTNKTTQIMSMGYYNFLTTGIANVTTNTYLNSVMFSKGSPNVNITINLDRVVDNTIIVATGVNGGKYPNQIFSFRIDPVMMNVNEIEKKHLIKRY
jgi:hypothetical protein